ncbi:hypothetical protein X740_05615 [Mesorhizobium sp. LNHC221B00]|nr:hypothetical protein X740_05615 [Mesorhizobium sp. LNHC221B00]
MVPRTTSSTGNALDLFAVGIAPVARATPHGPFCATVSKMLNF